MKHSLKLPPNITEGRWLSGAALWTVGGAWCAVGVWGWTQAASGIFLPLAITMTIAMQIFGMRALKNAFESGVRGIGLTILGLGCLVWSGYSGHQGMKINESDRWSDWDAKTAAEGKVLEAERALDAVPVVTPFDDNGRRVGPQTLAALGIERDKVIARKEATVAAARAEAARYARVEKPATKATDGLLWALTVLIEAMEAFGFLCLSSGRKIAAAITPAMSPSELARALVARRKDRLAVAA